MPKISAFSMGRSVCVTALACAIAQMHFASAPHAEASKWTFSQFYSIDDAAYASLPDEPAIQSFDLSPDGNELAVLVLGARVNAPLWISVHDLQTKRQVGLRKLGPVDRQVVSGQFAPQVWYAGNGRLVVNDFRAVVILDSKTLETVATVGAPKDPNQYPLSVAVARNADVMTCAFGPRQTYSYLTHVTPVTVEVVSASTGAASQTFAASDVPQAISPDGRLILMSTPNPVKGILPVAAFSIDGRKIAESTAGFEFRAKPVSDDSARVRGLFLADRTLVLSPGGTVDQSGHVASEAVRLADVTDTAINLTGRGATTHFVPTGEMASSSDAHSHTLVAISQYCDPKTIRQPHAVLRCDAPQAVFFERAGTELQLRASLPLRDIPVPSKSATQFEVWRPRLSSDGSVFAIEQGMKITVYRSVH